MMRKANRADAQQDVAFAKPRRVLGAAAGLGITVLGLALYGLLGQPFLAERSFHEPKENDYRALVAALATRIRERPQDIEGWVLLGRGYLALGDPANATKSLSRAIQLTNEQGRRPPPALLSAYGVALAEESRAVTPEAEAALRSALASDPEDIEARYYIGFAALQRGDRSEALSLWESVLRDAPEDAPFRPALVDQVAALKAQSGEAPPDIRAMVAGLAARLEKNPNDLEGWQRLVRAYTVLGDAEKAQAARAKALAVFASDPEATKALSAPVE
jgi:cytochrome c-type biogenesis protein CcmH